jgi:2'-5' RNA ligase
LQDAGVSGRWQQKGTHHLTLKYIGDIESKNYDVIADALREPCKALSPLPAFTVGPLFTFETPDTETVLAARVRPREELDELFQVLEKVVVENGGSKSEFPSYKPHCTICYLDESGKKAWQRVKDDLDLPKSFGELEITSVPLNESKSDNDDFEIRRRVKIGSRYYLASRLF